MVPEELRSDGWHATWPLPLIAIERDGAPAIRRWLASAPPRAAELAADCGRYGVVALHLLCHYRRAWQIARTANLLWLVASKLSRVDAAPGEMADALTHGKDEILSFALSRRVVRGAAAVLGRCDIPRTSAGRRLLASALTNRRVVRALHALPRVTSVQLSWMLAHDRSLRARWLRDALADGQNADTVLRLRDEALEHARGASVANAPAMIRKMSLSELLAAACRWEDRVERARQQRRARLSAATPLPRAPFDERPEILQLVAVGDLIEEGMAMENCIAKYAVDCFEGRYAAFRISAPQRATLLVDVRGRCVIDVRVAGDEPASAALQEEITAWLRSAKSRAT